MEPREHWQAVYSRKAPDEVSWFQREPRLSLELIGRSPNVPRDVLDVGGGASTLVDALLHTGSDRITVLDLAPAALASARARLGPDGERVGWIAADILNAPLADQSVDVWHDRAVFHFLVAPHERQRYVDQVRRLVRPGGQVLVATFAEDGPTRCSGLEVARYSSRALHATFGPGFELVASRREDHLTPSGVHQAFTYCLCVWDGGIAQHAA